MDNNGTVVPQLQGIDPATKISLYSVLLAWSLIGNSLVIIVVAWNKNLRTNFTLLIVNMAVSDLVIPLLALPVRIAQEAGGRPHEWLVDGQFGNALCKLCYFFADISPAVSIFSLVIVSVERFVLTVYPAKRYLFTSKLNCFLIGFTWFAAMALVSPYLYTFRLQKPEEGYIICYPSWSPAFDSASAQRVFILVVFVIAFLLPFASISILYSLMLYNINKKHKLINKNMSSSQECSLQRNKSVFYISISIVVVFGILWGPYYFWLFALNYIIKNPGARVVDFQIIGFSIQYLAYTNSCINPCIYFMFLKSFRRGLRNFCQRKHNDASLVSERYRKTESEEERNQMYEETKL